MEKIDLHIHTNISDGILTPKEVIQTAASNKVKTIAIADHDTIEAYTDELLDYAQKNNVNLIKAVEISTKNNKAGIHVLGYNIDINNQELKDKLYNLRNARHQYLINVSQKLQSLGYIVNVNDLDKIDSVTKAHIANDVIKNNKNKDLLLKNFGHIPNKGEFIETIMNEGCPAYVKKETITPKEAAEIIKKAGGKVILAHPVAYQYEDGLEEEDIKKIVLDMQADGIEAYYIYVDKNNNIINDSQKWEKFAKENHLITTIGSDFHNDDGIRPIIGLINENIVVDTNKILEDLKKVSN